MSNPEVTISLTAPANQQRDPNKHNPFSLAALDGASYGRIGGCIYLRLAEGDRIIGYVVAEPRRFFARDFVDLLMVHDDFRRRGVGRALLQAAVDRASTSRVFSSTNESNIAMRSMFASAGWMLSGQLNGLDEGDPEVVYFIDQ